MTLDRRTVLRAAALSPALLAIPSFGRAALAGDFLSVGRSQIVGDSSITGVALSWSGAAHEVVATVRAKIDGVWTQPIAVRADHGHGPVDPSGREYSPPVLVPGATEYDIVTEPSAAHDLRVHRLGDPEGTSAAVASSLLTTSEPIPGLVILDRTNWTTRIRRDTVDCTLRSSVDGLGCRSDVGLRHGIVHHTVNVNDYTEDEVPELLRGIQRYHMFTRGWDDIAYNFVIDRFGRIWHARYGDIADPVTGGHTTGLNSESVGVAILGTFTALDPGQAVVDSLAMLLGWKFSLHGIDPMGSTTVRSAGGDYADPGEMVTLRTISGHRDNQNTTCPGLGVYNRLDEVRLAAADLVTVFGFLEPTYSPTSVTVDGWAIDRLTPTAPVDVDITVDGVLFETIQANTTVDAIAQAYPAAGAAHAFAREVPITLDTRSIVVTARTADGRTATLMDLRMFATFIDVEPQRFFADGVYFLREHEITTGTQPGLFEPMDEMTRAQMAVFLHRYMGSKQASSPANFDDVPRNKWHTDAIDWLAETGITHGTSPTEFSPDSFITRGQMATFLWRMCGSPADSATNPFTDVAAGTYYEEPVRWLYDLAITHGSSATTFAPDATVTRGEMATFLHRLINTPAAWTTVDAPIMGANRPPATP